MNGRRRPAHRAPGRREAVAAAILFGGATPFAARLAGTASPQILAGLLYLGSGVFLAAVRALRSDRSARPEAPLGRDDRGPLIAAVILGGGVAPLLLMIGLEHTSAAGASLLLNLEVVFTALLAWAWFRDGVTARVGLGLAFVVAGAAIVSWEPGRLSGAWGAAAVAGACAAWGLDNNLTQLVSAKDPQQIAMIKGLVAGAANLVIGTVLGGRFPSPAGVGAAALIGVVGYGLSLVLFVTALRHLGTARTGGIFAVAPFVGVVVAVVGFGEPWRPVLGPAALLMAIGVVLQLGDRHDHQHHHERMVHDHAHRHDDGHHDHAHAVPIEPGIVHAHEHVHEARTHRHPHQPDIHHRHRHHHRVGRS